MSNGALGFKLKSFLANGLKANGFRGNAEVAASGIVGNLAVESGNFDPRVITTERRGDGGVAKGLAQWHPDRWGNLVDWANKTGQDPKTWQAQAGFIIYEMTKGGEREAWRRLEKAENPRQAAEAFLQYERPAGYKNNDPTGSSHYGDRVGHALIFGKNNTRSVPKTSEDVKSTTPTDTQVATPETQTQTAFSENMGTTVEAPDDYSEREKDLLFSMEMTRRANASLSKPIELENLLTKFRGP